MTNIGTLVLFSMVTVLLWSGLEKLRTFETSSETFSDFRRWINPVAAVVLLSLFELLCVVGLLVAPTSLITVCAILGLATIFAAGGVWALLTKKQIRCNCFGTLGSDGAVLGRAQLIWFVLWVVGIGVLTKFPPPPATVERLVATATIATLLLVGLRAVETLLATKTSKGDRLSADRMLTWLHSH
jgi:hypothetical protein